MTEKPGDDHKEQLEDTLGEFGALGYSLVKHDGTAVDLFYRDTLIATLPKSGLTKDIVRQRCRQFMFSRVHQDLRDTYGEELRRNG